MGLTLYSVIGGRGHVLAACPWGPRTPFLQAARTAAFVTRHDQLRRAGAPAARARLILHARHIPKKECGQWISYGQQFLTQRSENWFAHITPVKRNWTCYLRTSLPGAASCNASANLACNLFLQSRPPAFANAFLYDYSFFLSGHFAITSLFPSWKPVSLLAL